MMYFTIPINAISTGYPAAATDIYLDNQIQIQTTPSIRQVSFGEDYSLTIPLGSRKRTFSASMSNRSQAEADLIDDYFSLREGQLLQGFRILGAAADVVVLEWSKTFREVDTYSIQGNFKEVIR